MSETKLTFYSGTNTIGGTIFSIEYNGARVIADFGQGPLPQTFDARIHMQHTTDEYIKLGILPDIPEFYHESDIKTIVCISHLHLDHTALLGYVPDHVPIVMNEPTYQLHQALSEAGENDGNLSADRITAYPFYQEIKHGEITVKFIPVNHDIIGASAILITTPDQSIMYSGDLRLSNQDNYTQDWMKAAKHVDYLILETTQFSFDDKPEEFKNEEAPAHEFGTHHKYVLNIYQRNIQRIIEWIERTKSHGFKFIVDDRIAVLIEAFYEGDTSHIHYYDGYSSSYYHGNKITAITLEQAISLEKVVIQHDFMNMMQLIDLKLHDFYYLHSNGMPLGEYDPGFNVMHAWIERLGMTYVPYHESGHATKEQLEEIVATVQPGVLIPQHGFQPERLNYPNRLLPVPGETYIL